MYSLGFNLYFSGGTCLWKSTSPGHDLEMNTSNAIDFWADKGQGMFCSKTEKNPYHRSEDMSVNMGLHRTTWYVTVRWTALGGQIIFTWATIKGHHLLKLALVNVTITIWHAHAHKATPPWFIFRAFTCLLPWRWQPMKRDGASKATTTFSTPTAL